MATLTDKGRDELPDSMFAVPGKRKLPLHDADHVKLAWDMVDRTDGLTSAERKTARSHILRRAKELGLDTQGWKVHAVGFQVAAMSLEVPTVPDHPNRMPFSGILTRVDEPSDNPPTGATGKRVMIPKAVAEAAMASLLGMAIDFKPDFTGHDARSKIGVITEAHVEGNAVRIGGFLYANDFPTECARIRAEKESLGFSYECDVSIADPNADPWVATHVIFTGAAVLKKQLAAYTTTSIAAQSALPEFSMDPAELKKLIAESVGAAVKPLQDKIEALEKKPVQAAGVVHEMVKPHAEALRSCAAAMEKAGIGLHAEHGHVKILRHMADRMEAEGALGRLPHIYRDHDYIGAGTSAEHKLDAATQKLLTDLQDKVGAQDTQIADLKAKGIQAAAAPERKTISPEIKALLDKHSLTASAEEGKLTLAAVDKALEGLPHQARLAQKLRLRAAGILTAA